MSILQNPQKILLATRPITPPWDEASKNFAYFLAKSIKNKNLLIHLLTPRIQHRLEGIGENIIQTPIYSQTNFERAGYPLSQKLLLTKYLLTKSSDFDIIHYLFTPTKLNSTIIKYGNWIQKKLFHKNFTTIQTIATLREDINPVSIWKDIFFADTLITYSNYSKKKLIGAGFTNVSRIYPGIDLQKYSPQPKDEETLKHFNLSKDHFILSYFGEYARLGATDMLIDMLVKYLHDDSSRNIRFVFACRVKNDDDQKKKDEVITKLTEAGILDFVRFSDTFSDMPKLYNMTDIVLFPVENMRGKFDIPLVILEGYACKKPVIVSDLPIFEEFCNESICSIVPKNDGDALWQTIQGIMQNEHKKNALCENARAFVEQHFDLQNTAREYEEIFTSITL